MIVGRGTSVTFDTEKCFFCGDKPTTTHVHQFLDNEGNGLDFEGV